MSTNNKQLKISRITTRSDGVVSRSFHEDAFINNTGTFNINPVEKWIEALEENKKLYERLLQSEKDNVELLQSLLAKK